MQNSSTKTDGKNKVAAPARKVRRTIQVIKVSADIKKYIAGELGCSVDTVRNALDLSSPRQGEQPDRIRAMALKMGGVKSVDYKWVNA